MMLLAVTPLCVSACARHEPDKLEFAYVMLARDLRLETPCLKINEASATVSGFNPRGTQTSYLRSECYDALAATTGDTKWCAKVRRRWSAFLSGSNYTPAKCADRARSSRPLVMSIAYGLQDEALRAFGCTDDQAVASLPNGELFRQTDSMGALWVQVYTRLVANGALAKAVDRLPDFSRAGGGRPTTLTAGPSPCA